MKHKILLLLLFLMGILSSGAQNNTLTIPSVTAGQGKTISLPINLDNTADVVAVQFSLSLPEGITLQPTLASLNERAEGLNVTMREMTVGKYMAMIFSSTNQAIRGRTGTLMTVPLTVASSIEEGSVHPMILSDVIIGAIDGRNVATGFEAGTVSVAKSPDLEVSGVATSAATVNPGDEISIGWLVSNIGGMPTESGWNEQVYLEDSNGTEKLLSTVYYDSTLSVGGVVSRNASIVIPEITGVDGDCHIIVRLTPNRTSGEPSWLLENNTASSKSTIKVGKKLKITPGNLSIEEGKDEKARLYLTRSGNTLNDETFNIESTDDTRLSIPSNVTIAKGSSGVYIYVEITANGRLDGNSAINISLSGTDYDKATATIDIEDDTLPGLKIKSDTDAVTEGEIIKLVFETECAPGENLKIKLSCDFASRFNIPDIELPAGQTRVEAIVEAKEDDVPDVLQFVTFTASASGYSPGTFMVDLIDNDVPTLELSLTPDAVSESAGPLSVTAKLKRTDNIDKRVTVKFSDDSDGNIYYGNQTIEMAPGVEEITTSLGPVDNGIVDGERIYNISASVWIASCGCNVNSGTSGGVVTVPVTVYDDDGPCLSLSTSTSVLKEGEGAEITVSRNTAASSPLLVAISGESDVNLEYPATVTIPSGETSAVFTVKSVKSDTYNNDYTAILTAESEGFAKANICFMVSDQTLPDAQITAFDVSRKEIEAGEEISVVATLSNTGSYALPELTKIGFYHKDSPEPLATAYLQSDLPVGESVTITKNITLPDAVGRYTIYAVANDGRTVRELLYTNNTSKTLDITSISPFVFSVDIPKSVYQQGDTIHIGGKARGKDVANRAIEVYMINEGYRHVENVVTDGNGDFSINYMPYDNQMGHFIVGACYPKEGATGEMASFDICGLKRLDSSAIVCETLLGETFESSFKIKNYGSVALSGLKVSVDSKPDNCIVDIVSPTSIGSGQSEDIKFKITPIATSKGNEWEHIVLNVVTDEGARLNTTLYYYCYNPQGEIESSVSKIEATMTKGQARTYPISLRNNGKGSTGSITFSLPSWISTVTPGHIPSLESGESTDIVLQFNPSDDMSVNVAKYGTIGINCENGPGISLPYTIIPVSEDRGTLIVDVCDNYTYYTQAAPHVNNAKIVLKNPSTGQVVVTGQSDENGIFSVDMPEGYYSIDVTADSHAPYSNNIYINPGREEKVVVNLFIQTITIDWKVEETEVEDEYKIETIVHYETNVPAPVVKITVPEKIDGDNMAFGESTVINMLLTNVGLITACNNTIILPQGLSEWNFEALAYNEPFDLAPNQSVNVPVRITRMGESSQTEKNSVRKAANNTFSNCMAGLKDRYEYLCGEDISNNISAENMALKACAVAATMEMIMDAMGNIGGGAPDGPGGGPGGSGGGNVHSTEIDNPAPTRSFSICDPCDAARAEKIIDSLLGHTWLGMFNDAVNKAIEHYREGKDASNLRFVVRQTGEDITEKVRDMALDGIQDGLGDLVGYAIDVYEVVSACDDINSSKKVKSAQDKESSHSWNEKFDNVAMPLITQLQAIDEILLMTYGDRIWYNDMNDEKYGFLQYAQHLPEGYEPTDDELLAIKPESVTIGQMRAYIEHLDGKGAAFPTSESLTEQINIYDSVEAMALDNGFESMFEYYSDVLDGYARHFNEMTSGHTCASISLKLSQTMTMTRQAFRGTLTVFNGHEDTAMTDVRLNLVVRDNLGNHVTSHEMQINPENLTGFTGELAFDGGWTLNAGETGIATILFIPTKYAAPTEPQGYSFGGTLTYIDPFTGLEVIRNLYPVNLTVKPSPNLDLTYFMQRDVIGDDPLTDVVEPCEEAEFSLLINNLGYGDATNVKMVTEQPEIIENEKGLLIDFELMSSQLNGQDKTLALGGSVTTDFGTIPAKSTSYAQWWIKSSLLGHFTDYNVEATHVTSYDNPDLSLLNEVTIHELIRSIDVGEGEDMLKGFMTNDVVDADDTPDMMYLSNGEIEPVSVAASSEIKKLSDTDYSITVSPSSDGWNYGNIADPTYGVVKLNKVIRQSDGKEISLRNFWITDRTLRDGKDPLYENRIHFVDNFNGSGTETYLLTFEPMPDLRLEVIAIDGVPETVAHSHVELVYVMFNKEVDASTFTADDITLSVQGEKQDANLIGISTEDNKTFILDFTELNKTTGNGYYVLTIQSSDVIDAEGFNGISGKSVAWNMYKDGLLMIDTSVSPQEAGTIIGNRNVQYGETITLSAEPNEGYIFSHWTVDGENESKDTEWSTIAVSDMKVTANFVPKTFMVTVDCNGDGGYVNGTATGIYDFGHTARMEAIPNYGWSFSHWTVDGADMTSGNNILELSVDHDIEIYATFVSHIKELAIPLQQGWNWISSVFDDKELHNPMQFFKSIRPTLTEVRAKDGGLVMSDGILDGSIERMIPGTYKIKVNNSTSLKLKGATVTEDDYEVNLSPGWTWIPYLPADEQNISDALADFTARENDIIKSHTQFAVFSDGRWLGTLKSLLPNEGYMYYTAEPTAFKFSSSVVSGFTDANAGNAPWQYNERGFADNKTIIAKIYDNGTPVSDDDYIVGAFCGDECRGIGEYVGGLMFITVHGQQGDNISFKAIDSKSGVDRTVKESITFDENPLGSISIPYDLNLDKSSGVNDILVGYGLKITPNPVKEIMYIEGDLSNVESVKVIATSGITLISTDSFEHGVNVARLSDGVYVAAIVTTDGVLYKKFLKKRD